MTVHSEFVGDIANITQGGFVSFKFSGYSKRSGKPMNPRIYRVRNDVTSWEQLLQMNSQSTTDSNEKGKYNDPDILSLIPLSSSPQEYE
jgi:hypothetical protein